MRSMHRMRELVRLELMEKRPRPLVVVVVLVK
jgi:hypothetical protein